MTDTPDTPDDPGNVVDLTQRGSVRKSTPGHGGKREGAGRPAGSTIGRPVGTGKKVQNDAYTVLAQARAKREMFKAQLTELEYREKAGELYPRAEIMQTFTTTIAIFAEQMRGIPDMLERKAGLTPRQAESAAEEIESQLEELKRRLTGALADG